MTSIIPERSTHQRAPSADWSSRYRGAAVEDLDPPAALSLTPSDPISLALLSAFERDYTHLTIVDSHTRSLIGYISIPQLNALLQAGKVNTSDPVSAAMTRFQRRGRRYRVITMQTPLEELEAFFRGDAQRKDHDQGQGQDQDQDQDQDQGQGQGQGEGQGKGEGEGEGEGKGQGEWAQEFAVITDENRRFVLGVATVQDLEEFVNRRPA